VYTVRLYAVLVQMFVTPAPRNVKNMPKWAWSIAEYALRLVENAQKLVNRWQQPLKICLIILTCPKTRVRIMYIFYKIL
jgi:hypothetical protein